MIERDEVYVAVRRPVMQEEGENIEWLDYSTISCDCGFTRMLTEKTAYMDKTAPVVRIAKIKLTSYEKNAVC